MANHRNNNDEVSDSDSDQDELDYLLNQSSSQLRFIDTVFEKLLSAEEDLPENASTIEYVNSSYCFFAGFWLVT